MDDVLWYYAVDGQRQGPVPFDQLRRLAASGQLTPGDLVWTQGMADWQPAGSIPSLAPPRVQQPKPIPQPYAYAHAPQTVQYQSPIAAGGGSGASYQGLAIAGFVLSLLIFF